MRFWNKNILFLFRPTTILKHHLLRIIHYNCVCLPMSCTCFQVWQSQFLRIVIKNLMRQLIVVGEWCYLIVFIRSLNVFMSILLMLILPFVLIGKGSLGVDYYILSVLTRFLCLFKLVFAWFELQINLFLLEESIPDFILDLSKSLFHSFIINFLLSLVAKHWNLRCIEASDTVRELVINLLHCFPLFKSQRLFGPPVFIVNLILVLNKFIHLMSLIV